MKKIFKKSFLVFLLVLMLPVTLFLSGCGATPVNEIHAVFFDTKIYEDGVPVFEVDLNTPTYFPYKINPSTAVNYVPKWDNPYQGKDTSNNVNRYEFNKEYDGKLIVTNEKFEDIKIRVFFGDTCSDTAIVRLKKYPISIRADVSNVSLNTSGAYTICPVGTFLNDDGVTTYERPLLASEYNFVVTSSNESIVSVANSSRLEICSEIKNSVAITSATVTVELKDTIGRAKTGSDGNPLKFDIQVNIVPSAVTGYVDIKGKNYDVGTTNPAGFIEDGDTVEIKLNEMSKNSQDDKYFVYDAFFESNLGNLILPEDIFCTSNNSSYFNVDSEEQTVTLLVDDAYITGKTFTFKMWSVYNDVSGKLYVISFNIKFS